MTAAYAVGLFFANELANLVVSTPFWLSLGCLLAASRPPAGSGTHMIDGRQEILAGDRFAFGSNWRAFIDLVDEQRIGAAVDSLTGPLGTRDLTGRTFLDAGCGSGLFSLAAHRLGARVRSFDYDPTPSPRRLELRDRFAEDADWDVSQGSILDEETVADLGRFDVVYSWGVLHHTGDLWHATGHRRRPGGAGRPAVHLRLQRPGVREPHVAARQAPLQQVRRADPAAARARQRRLPAPAAAAGEPPARGPRRRPGARTRRRGRAACRPGTTWSTGSAGTPSRSPSPSRCSRFLRERGFELRHLKTCAGGLGCNEYVFARSGRPESLGTGRAT